MPKTIDFIFDFASPNAYFAHHALKKLSVRTGAEVNYIPCLLGGIFKATGNQAPMMAFANVKGKLSYDMLEIQRFIAKHGLSKFVMNPHFPINTVLIQRGALVALQDGKLNEFIETGLALMWEEKKNMGDKDVFIEALTQYGFDGADIFERTQSPKIKTQLIENTAMAVERGAFGIPTFYVGGEMFFGKDRITQMEEQIFMNS